MRPNDMLSRSKIKMQESIRHVREDVPYFNSGQEDHAGLFYKYARGETNQEEKVQRAYQPKRTETNLATQTINRYQNNYTTQYTEPVFIDNGFRKEKSNRNEIMRELRQQYEILRNLNIEDSIHIHTNKYEHTKEERHSSRHDDQNSDLSSSAHSKRGKGKKRDHQTSKQVYAIAMQKKQLQIVIGNSMRKIEELLNSEILLKKQIHQLKSQIDGKGGIHYQYEKTIKSYQKNQEEHISEINKQKHELEKNSLKIKDLTERIRHLETELSTKDREIKQHFDKQRELYEAVRVQKDKFLNMEIQWKSLKMELDLLQKQKDNQINRLLRQYEGKDTANGKQANFIIKKLEEDLRQKQHKYFALYSEHEYLKKQFESKESYNEKKQAEKQKGADKNLLEDLLFRSREANENNNKALTDSMNLIFMKMAELQKKSDETMKKQIESLKKKTEANAKNTNEQQLLARVIQLQKMIDRQITEKNKLAQDIRDMNEHRNELQTRNIKMERHIKDLNEVQENLKREIEELEHLKNAYHSTAHENKEIKGQLESYLIRERETSAYLQNSKVLAKTKEQGYEEEIRNLRRKVDQANFATEKARKQGEFQLNMFKTEHMSEYQRLLADYNRIKDTTGASDQNSTRIRAQLQAKLVQKDKQIEVLKESIENMRKSHSQELESQKKYYEEQIKTVQTRTTSQIKTFNDRFIAISTSNQKLMSQISNYAILEKEVIELRRALRLSKSMNTGVDHLWQVKEAEYSNMNDLLRTMSSQGRSW